ncbi:hypothetical protein U1Q18_017677, partial [Sarracenia purpurea var. burkii]
MPILIQLLCILVVATSLLCAMPFADMAWLMLCNVACFGCLAVALDFWDTLRVPCFAMWVDGYMEQHQETKWSGWPNRGCAARVTLICCCDMGCIRLGAGCVAWLLCWTSMQNLNSWALIVDMCKCTQRGSWAVMFEIPKLPSGK